MAANGITELQNLIPTIWAPKMYDELRASLMIASFFNSEYTGSITSMGDVVKVNQIAAPVAEILTDDKQEFSSQSLTVNQKTITANKRASASFEFTDLAQLQSMSFQQEAQSALIFAVLKAMESDVLSGLVPSASAPDHQIAPASAGVLAPVDIGTARTLLSQQLVPNADRMGFLDPSYFGDLLTATQITSRDFVDNTNNAQYGRIASFGGFALAEANLLPTETAYFAHKSAMQVVMQQSLRIKLSDLHPTHKYGYLISADIVYGWSLFDSKRVVKISG